MITLHILLLFPVVSFIQIAGIQLIPGSLLVVVIGLVDVASSRVDPFACKTQ